MNQVIMLMNIMISQEVRHFIRILDMEYYRFSRFFGILTDDITDSRLHNLSFAISIQTCKGRYYH